MHQYFSLPPQILIFVLNAFLISSICHTFLSPCGGVDLGHGWPGEVPVSGRSILSRSRLLCAGVWCDCAQHLQDTRQLEGWVPDPGEPSRSGELPLRGARQQDWLGEQTGWYWSTAATWCWKSFNDHILDYLMNTQLSLFIFSKLILVGKVQGTWTYNYRCS